MSDVLTPGGKRQDIGEFVRPLRTSPTNTSPNFSGMVTTPAPVSAAAPEGSFSRGFKAGQRDIAAILLTRLLQTANSPEASDSLRLSAEVLYHRLTDEAKPLLAD